jgi:hypothetical protein
VQVDPLSQYTLILDVGFLIISYTQYSSTSPMKHTGTSLCRRHEVLVHIRGITRLKFSTRDRDAQGIPVDFKLSVTVMSPEFFRSDQHISQRGGMKLDESKTGRDREIITMRSKYLAE